MKDLGYQTEMLTWIFQPAFGIRVIKGAEEAGLASGISLPVSRLVQLELIQHRIISKGKHLYIRSTGQVSSGQGMARAQLACVKTPMARVPCHRYMSSVHETITKSTQACTHDLEPGLLHVVMQCIHGNGHIRKDV